MLPCLAFQKDITCPCNMSKLGWSMGDSVCDSLIGLPAFRGCDTMSAFVSRVKLSVLKLMKRDITCHETFSKVHHVQSWLFEKVQQFTCMYVAASSTTEVNDLRYQLFLRGWDQSASTMQRLSLRAPPSSQLSSNNLEVLSACSSHSARPYQVWMDRWWWQARHSLDAVAISTRCCPGIDGLQVCPFLQAAKMYVANRPACTDIVMQVAVLQ